MATSPESGVPVEQAKRKPISHPLLTEFIQRLELELASQDDAQLVLAIGPAGVGKTTALSALVRRLIERNAEAMRLDHSFLPAFAMQAPSAGGKEFAWSFFYDEALRALREPLVDRKVSAIDDPGVRIGKAARTKRHTLLGQQSALVHALRHRRVQMMAIDEAVHITRGKRPDRLAQDLDALKAMANGCSATFVLFGAYDLLPLLSLSGQVSRRTTVVHLERYRKGDADRERQFRKALAALAERLPYAAPPSLDRYAELLMVNSLGCIGLLSHVLWRMYRRSEERHGQFREADLMRSLFSTVQVDTMEREIRDGERRIADHTDFRVVEVS